MKKTDIAMIILIASISVLVSYFVADAIPALKTDKQEAKVKTIDRYSADPGTVDPTVFSNDAINPTVEITIGTNQ